MKTKVLLFLLAFLTLIACGGDDAAQNEPEKPTSSHLADIQNTTFKTVGFLRLVNDNKELIGHVLCLTGNGLTVNVTIAPGEFTTIPGSGNITDADVSYSQSYQVTSGNNKSYKTETWKMQAVNYGRYAFKGGRAIVGFVDDDHLSVRLSFGPIVDENSVIDKVEIDCVCKYSKEQHFRK